MDKKDRSNLQSTSLDNRDYANNGLQVLRSEKSAQRGATAWQSNDFNGTEQMVIFPFPTGAKGGAEQHSPKSRWGDWNKHTTRELSYADSVHLLNSPYVIGI